MEVSSGYLPVLSPLLQPGTSLAAQELGFLHTALTSLLLSLQFHSGVAGWDWGEAAALHGCVLRVSGQNLPAFGNKGAQKSPECRIVTIRPPPSKELREEGNQMAPLNPK